MGRTGDDKFSDRREAAWPKGLYRRVDSYRFKRTVHGRKYQEVWGSIAHDDAVRRAQRYNLDIADGKDPIQAQAARSMTFDAFAYGTWLKIALTAWVTGARWASIPCTHLMGGAKRHTAMSDVTHADGAARSVRPIGGITCEL